MTAPDAQIDIALRELRIKGQPDGAVLHRVDEEAPRHRRVVGAERGPHAEVVAARRRVVGQRELAARRNDIESRGEG